MSNIIHFFSTLLHTIDRTMESETLADHRWSDRVSEEEHLKNVAAETKVSTKENDGPADISHP